jgi:hypothetical protein
MTDRTAELEAALRAEDALIAGATIALELFVEADRGASARSSVAQRNLALICRFGLTYLHCTLLVQQRLGTARNLLEVVPSKRVEDTLSRCEEV